MSCMFVCRLTQEFLLDMYCSLESQRLWYIKANQPKLRAELYGGVQDAIRRGDTNASKVGRRIVLPATFTGGPRHMFQLYMDSMALVRHFTKPTLFITFTCNPEWPEILAALHPGQTPNDRPDLLARAFRVRLKQLIEDLIKNEVCTSAPLYPYFVYCDTCRIL
jgi:Helitron helicase-like domain at N-terminus